MSQKGRYISLIIHRFTKKVQKNADTRINKAKKRSDNYKEDNE